MSGCDKHRLFKQRCQTFCLDTYRLARKGAKLPVRAAMKESLMKTIQLSMFTTEETE